LAAAAAFAAGLGLATAFAAGLSALTGTSCLFGGSSGNHLVLIPHQRGLLNGLVKSKDPGIHTQTTL
jgi:hypothetical protein